MRSWLFWKKSQTSSRTLQVSAPQLMAPAVVLGIDGVLHAFQRGTLERLPLFEAFLRASPSVRVVISSTWRMQNSLEDLRELFAADVQHQIEGVTPFLNRTPFSRFQEIQAYLLESGVRKWCALDDEAYLFPPECPNLVQANAAVGVTLGDLARVARVLAL